MNEWIIVLSIITILVGSLAAIVLYSAGYQKGKNSATAELDEAKQFRSEGMKAMRAAAAEMEQAKTFAQEALAEKTETHQLLIQVRDEYLKINEALAND